MYHHLEIVTWNISILRKCHPEQNERQSSASEESGSTSVQGRRLFKCSRALDLHKFQISNARKNARCLIHVMQLNEMQRISLSFPLVNFLLQLKSRVYCLNCLDEPDKNLENVARIVLNMCVLCSQFFGVK